MGIIPDINETAKSAIEALKQTPVVLALLLFNITFIGMQFWASHEDGDRWERTIRYQTESCNTLITALRDGGFKLQSDRGVDHQGN